MLSVTENGRFTKNDWIICALEMGEFYQRVWCSELGKADFPGGTVVKNPPANAGDTGLSPAPGRSHMPQSN